MEHIYNQKYSEREQYLTCCRCGKPLSDNTIIKDAYILSTQFHWLRQQIKIVADMIKDSGNATHADIIYTLLDKANKSLRF